jgi:glycine/D-amino acid oxidase-like deaminating enzyme
MLKSDPYWWDSFAPFKDQPDNFPTECDVVIVGAGLTGCSAALTLAKAGKNVVLLDAQRPGFGASTRNGGMIGGGYRLSLEEMSARYGADTAHQLLVESHIDSLEFAVSRIRDEGIDCDYNQYGRFRGMWNKAEYDETAKGLDDLRKLVPVNIEMVAPKDQRKEVGSDLYSGGMLLHDHGGIHPGKYLNGMLKAAVRAGADVFGNTLVTDVKSDGSGFVVRSDKGAIRAGAVLMATNGYTTRDFPKLKRRMIPVSSFLIATDELPQSVVDDIMPARRMCVETRNRHCYYRLSPDSKRLVLGGRAAMNKISAVRSAKVLRGLMEQIFPQLKGQGLSHSWTGQTGFTFSFMPQISQFNGVWHAMGYSGSGNAMAPYLGHKAALQMIGDPKGETAFNKTTLETRFWYQKSPWFLPFAQQVYRIKDLRDNMTRAK